VNVTHNAAAILKCDGTWNSGGKFHLWISSGARNLPYEVGFKKPIVIDAGDPDGWLARRREATVLAESIRWYPARRSASDCQEQDRSLRPEVQQRPAGLRACAQDDRLEPVSIADPRMCRLAVSQPIAWEGMLIRRSLWHLWLMPAPLKP